MSSTKGIPFILPSFFEKEKHFPSFLQLYPKPIPFSGSVFYLEREYMTMKRKTLWILLPVLAAFLSLAVIFGVYDLEISKALVNFESRFGNLFETIGMFAAPILCTLSGLALIAYVLRSRGNHFYWKLILSILAALAGIGFHVYLCCEFSATVSLILIFLSGIFYGLCGGWLMRCDIALLKKLMRIALISIFYMLAMLLVINGIKYPWGRWRFREMDESLAQFTPWFFPQGFTGHRSFPSGHTANAAISWSLTLLAPLFQVRWKKSLCYLIPSLWIFTVAFSRIIVGAHFASDVLFGAGISIALFYLVRFLVNRKLPE